jgi:hypothetical protein
MFPEARSHRLEVVPRPVVIPAPDDTAARSMWQALIDLANLCRDAHARDHTDRAREVVGSALRELRQALGDREQPRDWMTHSEAAEYLGKTRDALYTLVRRRRISPSNKKHGQKGESVFTREELDRFRTSVELSRKARRKS